MQFKRHCDFQHYERPEGRLLRIVGLLPRCSDEWKAEYQKRTSIERYLSSVKHSRLMNQHRNFNIIQMSLHVLMSTLTYLVTALAHLQADDYAHMRRMRIKLPRVQRRRAAARPEQSRQAPRATPVAKGDTKRRSGSFTKAPLAKRAPYAANQWELGWQAGQIHGTVIDTSAGLSHLARRILL